MRVALTQSGGALIGLDDALRERGFNVVRHPLIQTKTLSTEEVRLAARRLLECPWLLFTSLKAVNAWQDLGLSWTKHQGAVGETTAQALCDKGANVSLVAAPPTSEGLADSFLNHKDAAAPVGLPRGNQALKIVETLLSAHNFATKPLTVYQTDALPWTLHDIDIVLLSSPSAVKALPRNVGQMSRLIALGPSTAQAITKRGWTCLQAEAPTLESLLELFEKEVKHAHQRKG